MCISSGKPQDRHRAGLGHCPWVFSPFLVFQSPAMLWCNPGLEEGGTKWPLWSQHAVLGYLGHKKMQLCSRFPWSHGTEEVKKLPSELYTS